MNHRSHGFTLIEVLIALGILVSSVFVLSSLQIRSLFRILKDRERIEKTFLIKTELYKALIKPPLQGKPIVINNKQNMLAITSEKIELQKQSNLIDLKDQLSLIKSSGQWTSDTGNKQSLDMVSMAFQKIKKDKKKSP